MIVELLEDNFTIYYRDRKIPTIPLYLTATLSHVQFIAPYVAKRLVDLGVEKFRKLDPVATRVIELACRGRCRGEEDGVDIAAVLEEAYYNYLADRIVAHTAAVDALIIPCADAPLAKALARRTREYAPDLVTIGSKYGGDCPEVDYIHTPQPVDTPLPLGPVSRAALNTAMWAVDEEIAEAPLTPLLDASRC